MQRVIAATGMLLLVLGIGACGQVRTRTRTGGYPLWDVPAGAALERSFQAPVKTADPADLARQKEQNGAK